MGQFIYGKPSQNNASGPTTILPSDLSNLVGWYRADGITGKSDGDALTTWSDESGNSNDLTATNSPTYETNEQNTLPVVRLNGSTQYLSRTNFGGSTGTYIIAAKNKTLTGADYILGVSDTGAVGNHLALYRTAGSLHIEQAHSAAAETEGNVANGAMADNRAFILSWSTSGSAWENTVNGQTVTFSFSTGSNDGEWDDDVTGVDTFYVGALVRDSAAAHIEMDVCELIVYSDQKTGSDLTNLILYLNQKWMIY